MHKIIATRKEKVWLFRYNKKINGIDNSFNQNVGHFG